jgi:hypothetical protein
MTFLLAFCLAVLDAGFPCRGTLGPREPDPAVLASPRHRGATGEEVGTFARWLQDQLIGIPVVTQPNFLRLHTGFSEDKVMTVFGATGSTTPTGFRQDTDWPSEPCHITSRFSEFVGEGALSGPLTADDGWVPALPLDPSSLFDQLRLPVDPARGPHLGTPFSD